MSKTGSETRHYLLKMVYVIGFVLEFINIINTHSVIPKYLRNLVNVLTKMLIFLSYSWVINQSFQTTFFHTTDFVQISYFTSGVTGEPLTNKQIAYVKGPLVGIELTIFGLWGAIPTDVVTRRKWLHNSYYSS
jgi:hypothetical protein